MDIPIEMVNMRKRPRFFQADLSRTGIIRFIRLNYPLPIIILRNPRDEGG